MAPGSRPMAAILISKPVLLLILLVAAAEQTTADDGDQLSRHGPGLDLYAESIRTIARLCYSPITPTLDYKGEVLILDNVCAFYRNKFQKLVKRGISMFHILPDDAKMARIRNALAKDKTPEMRFSQRAWERMAALRRATTELVAYCYANLSFCLSSYDEISFYFKRIPKRG
eukprot:scpid74517/ scgid23463/ 